MVVAFEKLYLEILKYEDEQGVDYRILVKVQASGLCKQGLKKGLKVKRE